MMIRSALYTIYRPRDENANHYTACGKQQEHSTFC